MIPEPTDRTDTAREIDELSFLVGTSCSRTITLLMQSQGEREALRGELEFLADKAGRLAALLTGPEGDAQRSG